MSQHSKALQALGLQDSSPSKPSPEGAHPQAVAEPKMEHLEGVTIESVFKQGTADAHAAATADAGGATDPAAAGVGDQGITRVGEGHDEPVPKESNMLSASKEVREHHAAGAAAAAAVSGSSSQPPGAAANDLSPTAAKGRAMFRHQR